MTPRFGLVTAFLVVLGSLAASVLAEGIQRNLAGFPFLVARQDQKRYERHENAARTLSASVAILLPRSAEKAAGGEKWVADLLVEESEGYRWVDRASGSPGAVVRLALEGLRDRESYCIAVAEAAGAGVYRLSETFRCFDPPGTIKFKTKARETLSGKVPPALAAARPVPALRWIASLGATPSEWPKCAIASGNWRCLGAAIGQPGVVASLVTPETLVSLPVRVERSKSVLLGWQSAGWGRLACLTWRGEAVAPSAVRIEKRAGWHFMRLEPARAAKVDSLGAGCYWLSITEPLTPLLVLDADGSTVGRRVMTLGLLSESPLTSPVAIRMDSPATLRGRLESPHRDAALAVTEVDLFSEEDGAEATERDKDEAPHVGFLLATTKSDSRGRFRFADLAPETYVVRACEPHLGCGEARALAGGGAAKLRLNAAHYLEGKVTHAGEPVAGAQVSVRPTPRTYATSEDAVRLFVPPGRTDAHGAFVLAAPASGVFRVSVEAKGHGTLFRRVGPVEKLPKVIDLGTIDLPDPVETEFGLADCPGGEILLVGPLGQDAIPESRKIELDALGRGTGELAASGDYAVMAKCGKQTVSVVPNPLHVPQGVSKAIEVLRRAYLATP